VGDDHETVFALFMEGQRAIFAKLDGLSVAIQAIPVHGNDISHLKSAVEEMKLNCARHKPTPKPSVWAQVANDLIRLSAAFVFCLLVYTCFTNAEKYMNQPRPITIVK